MPYYTIFEPYAPLFADGLGDKIILFIPIATKSRFFFSINWGGYSAQTARRFPREIRHRFAVSESNAFTLEYSTVRFALSGKEV